MLTHLCAITVVRRITSMQFDKAIGPEETSRTGAAVRAPVARFAVLGPWRSGVVRIPVGYPNQPLVLMPAHKT